MAPNSLLSTDPHVQSRLDNSNYGYHAHRGGTHHAPLSGEGALSSRDDAEVACPTCGSEKPPLRVPHAAQQFVFTPAKDKTAKQAPVRTFAFHQVNVSSATGKVDAKDLSKARAYLMKQVHQKRRFVQSKVQIQKEFEVTHQIWSVLGAGRCDPFLKLPLPSVPRRYHELVDYCVSTLWPRMKDKSYAFAYAREWLSQAGEDSAFLHSLLFSASSHLEAVRSQQNDLDTRKRMRLEQLQQKGDAIRAIHHALAEKDHHESDGLIQSILFLAMNETGDDEEPPDWSPFSPPFTTLQWLHIYGSRTYFLPHVIAVQAIIKKRGGIRNLKTIGLSWMITICELISCASTLKQPEYPLLSLNSDDINYIPFSSSPPTTPDTTNSPGIAYLAQAGLPQRIISIFLKVRDYSHAIEVYEHMDINRVPEFMSDNRNWVLHRVLCLPSAFASALETAFLKTSENTIAQPEDIPSEIAHTYEVFRIAMLLYCVHVTFPTPRSLHPRVILLTSLRAAMERMELYDSLVGVDIGREEVGELLLWCVVVGGIAAKGRDERGWFLERRDDLMLQLGLEEEGWSGDRVKGMMRGVAWVESACGVAGEDFWEEEEVWEDEEGEGDL